MIEKMVIKKCDLSKGILVIERTLQDHQGNTDVKQYHVDSQMIRDQIRKILKIDYA